MITKLEKQYFQWLRSDFRPCIYPNCEATDIQYHHLKFNDTDTIHTSTAKKNHKLVVPVCKNHHTGKECSFHSNKKELSKYFNKESLTIIANRYYQGFLDSSLSNLDDNLVFDDIL